MPPLQYSWLVSYDSESKEDTDHIFFSTTGSPDFHQNQHYHCRIPELRGRDIRGCFYGWLLLSSYPLSPTDLNVLEFSLWNPVTSTFILLPRLKLELKPDDDANQYDTDDIFSCCLSSPPSDQNSVLLLSRFSKPSIVFCLLRRKRKLWTEMSYANQIKNLYNSDNDLIQTLTCCNDKVYAFTHPQRRLIQVDIRICQARNVVINLLEFGMLPICGLHSFATYLTGYCKELFTIIECYRFEKLQSIKLFKLDFAIMEWEELKSAKDCVFLLVWGHYSQISCHAIESESGTYIHSIWNSCNVYSYNLEDKTVSLSSLHCPDLSPERRSCYTLPWVMPKSRLVDDHGEAKCKSETEEEQGKEEELVVRSVISSEVDSMMNEQPGEKLIATTDQGSILLNIPLHILDLIVEDLIAVDYLNFRATCKHCRLAAPPIQWSSATALGRLQTRTPWLMALDEHQGITTFTDPKFGDKYFMTTFFELNGHVGICASKYGWLLILKGDFFINPFFFNPFTKATVQLPELRLNLASFAFSEPPTSPSCIVAAFTYYDGTVYITFPGESDWDAINIHSDIPYNLSLHNNPIFHGKNLYILCQDGELGVFRFDQDLTCETLVAERTLCTSSTERRFLVECGEDLLSIIMGEFGEWVKVFKLNHSTLGWGWEKVYDIGNHMIFVCDTSCFSVVATISGMENKIYFPRFRGGSIVFYSLDTSKFHTFGGEGEALKDFCFPTKEQLMCVWIEPSWSS